MKKYKIVLLITYIILILLTNMLGLLAKSTFSSAKLETSVKEYIINNLKNDPIFNKYGKEFDLDITLLKKLNNYSFADDGVEAFLDFKGISIDGICSVNLVFQSESKTIDKIEIKAYYKVYTFIPVAKINLRIGEKLKSDQFEILKKDITNSEFLVDKASDFEGKTLLKNIRRGDYIAKSDITSESKVVKRGDKVNIKVVYDNVTIHAVGTAMQDAQVGKILKLQREGNPEILLGKLEEDGSVSIINNN